jgi:hypothetical protein
MSKQKNQSPLIKPWRISSCLGPHHICPETWKNKFIEHEIHCNCNCHKNKNSNADTEFCYSTDTKANTKLLTSEKKRRL